MTERVKQTTKDVYNLSVILLGLGIFSIVSYGIFKEFFSSKSPSGLFSTALKKCKADERIIDLLGQPIKGFGEMTSRRRARHVSFVEYENNGSMNTATVHCETDKSSPRSHVRYLYAEIDTYPKKIVILEDNRLMDDTSSSNSLIN
ncbi:TIM21-like protein [Sarcoptes scabiei]|uniref:Mitochondrial import inner membrane translocase subunit Tim21 n=1 Tax=Sarcoptes scabiei TaxID=52283 RepID=A0A132AGZ7_SARSC|nr:TIM21-like protein [Sarcoptes scabiei]